ncbi:hypothetical protein PHLGIDRAFT_20262 [Phlebiopsis gigantea 11061_1 CR5-6]|uniref:NAD(P)-binding protein n=1 Tax=Phlebiopsis gigantea (strain 11061_1 CR5-6) TaxID=745531 RepID=A0A0C3RSI5_PHLG1|nr:hypothetical protein PHLGIDRAFT_20262 [Phlebiopsis gigantea 11061_1 CR5-6]
MSTSRVWLITGSSSGFGRRLVEFALARGERVVATLRTPSDLDGLASEYSSHQLLVTKLDVTDRSAIAGAFHEAKSAFGRVDVVFNNAGCWMLGEVESTPEDVARRLFDVNFWGAANVSSETVRFFREDNPRGAGGRLIVVSSDAGIAPFVSNGYYNASKFALEGLTQTLSQELDPEWNIKITIIEPGYFRTPIVDKATQLPIHTAHANPAGAVVKQREHEDQTFEDPNYKIGDVRKAVEKIFELAGLPTPPLRLAMGLDAVSKIRSQIAQLGDELEAYEGWSSDLLER